MIALTAADARAEDGETPAPPPTQPPQPPAPQPPPPAPPQQEEEPKPKMSEGRALVSAYHAGFQLGLAPGILIGRNRTSFLFAARVGYGFDLGAVILSPGLRVGMYFLDPNVYLGVPLMKVLFPIDRFVPFVEGGVGIGHLTKSALIPEHTGAVYLAGGGFMLHFTKVVLGAEAIYQTMPGTEFAGLSIGPILAIGF